MNLDENNTIIEKYFYLAVKIANKFKLNDDEVLSDAMLGLVRAARGFKPEKGFRFITYAWAMISGAIKSGIRNRVAKSSRIETLYAEPSIIIEKPFNEVFEWLSEPFKTKIESKIIYSKVVEGMSFAEIGRKTGRTREAIRQRYNKAINTIKDFHHGEYN